MNFNEHLEYRDGELYWKKAGFGRTLGSKAGSKTKSKNYLYIAVNGKRYSNHRVIWMMHNGYIESSQHIDHINGDSYDNRIENLRLATQQENNCNSKSRRGSQSKYKGVNWHKRVKKWVAQGGAVGKKYHLGYFDLEEDAACAYNLFALKHHGEFAYLNNHKLNEEVDSGA